MIRRVLALALLCAAFAYPRARAESDDVQFFSNIDVPADSTVHDAVCFFCNVNLEGKSTGDVVVFFGNVHVANEAQHDVVNFFGHVTADDNASIDHNLVSFFGGVRLGEDVHVGEDLVTMFGALRAGRGVSVGGDRVVQPAWLFFGPLGFLSLIVILIVREFRAYRRRLYLRGYGFPPYP
jgi:hypothetical protein